MIAPSAADERLMEVRRRGLPAHPAVEWRTNGTWLSLLFFCLTSVAVSALYGLFALINFPGAAFIVAGMCIGSAEWLIRSRRFFGTGIESALWLAGLFCFIFGLPGEGSMDVLLLFAAAAALAGWRMRNALFGVLAAVFVISWAMARDAAHLAASLGVLIALTSLAALAREWRRPSTERLFIALLVLAPIAGIVATASSLDVWWVVVYLVVAVVCLWYGLRFRAHAPLIAAGVNVAIAAGIAAAHDLLPLVLEWRLVLAGASLLAASAALSRHLRSRESGVVATPDELTSADGTVEIVATIVAQPQVAVAESPEGGGRFGGGGATSGY